MKEFIFTWRIENINYSGHATGQEIFSPTFTAGPIKNSVWTLRLYPRGKLDGDYISLFLYRDEDDCSENISINFQISCISAENSTLRSYTFSEHDKSFAKNDGFGHPRFMRRLEVFFQRKDLYLPDDTLTLRCRMWKNKNFNSSEESFGLTRLDIERILTVEIIKPEVGEDTTLNIQSKRQNKALVSIDTLQFEDTIRVWIKPTNVENIKFCDLKLWFVNKSSRRILCEHMSSWLGPPRQEVWRLPLVSKALDTGNQGSIEDSVELLSEFVYSTGMETNQFEVEDPHSSRVPELVSKYKAACISVGNLLDCPRTSHDLWNLYVEQVLCDVELKTQTTSFFVHKFVLCARSTVFLAMLTGDMREMRNKCIEIEDIGDDILSKFLCFLYTDVFENLELDAVIGLYYASDKYQVTRLKILCSSFFMMNICVDNVCELLMLADRHHDSDFKRRVQDFIIRNDQEIFSSSSWKEFANEEPLLSIQTMLLKYDKERENENSADTYEIKLSRLPDVQDDFTAAYQLEIISDFVIKTTDATFNAHKSILCASSPIMEEMLTRDQPTDSFEIPDLKSDTVSRLLFFLHTDSLGDPQWDTTIKLYQAANVYQIQRLKIKCSCFLLENLGTSNASELLLLADEHQDAGLKSLVENFIILHDEEIFGSDAWADFSAINPRLAIDTMRSKYRRNCGISLSKSFLNRD